MPSTVSELFADFDEQQKKLLEDFFTFLRFESISTDPQYQEQIIACAKWLAAYLTDAGLEVETWPTSGHPVLFASSKPSNPDKPTVLIYNHYDVQPIDPLELWESPPFEPSVRDGEIFARGAQDNKGQCFYVITAIKRMLEKNGELPVNLKLLIEGEEECASAGLSGILAEKAEALQAEHLMVVDVGILSPESPSVGLGVRGIATLELKLSGSNSDLHSGSHGGIVYNPNRAMVELLAKLYREDGSVAVPGFYQEVAELNSSDRETIDFDFDEQSYQAAFASSTSGGERAYTPLERAWIRPTLEINGVSGGYSGEGFKTVIPAQAIAKISCRLVPRQDPRKTIDLVANFLRENCPKGVSIEVDVHPGAGQAVRTNSNCQIVQAAKKAFSEVAGKKANFTLEGGSIPIVAELSKAAGAEVVLIGYGLPGDNMHAPNEHFGIDRLKRGFASIWRTLEILSQE